MSQRRPNSALLSLLADVIDVPCPGCWAGAGAACRNRFTGGQTRAPHPRRIRHAAEMAAKAATPSEAA